MKEIADSLLLNYKKIENWFKRQRRRDVCQGKIKYEVER